MCQHSVHNLASVSNTSRQTLLLRFERQHASQKGRRRSRLAVHSLGKRCWENRLLERSRRDVGACLLLSLGSFLQLDSVLCSPLEIHTAQGYRVVMLQVELNVISVWRFNQKLEERDGSYFNLGLAFQKQYGPARDTSQTYPLCQLNLQDAHALSLPSFNRSRDSPEPVKLPRSKLKQQFAVLLMRSVYDAVDALDFVSMVIASCCHVSWHTNLCSVMLWLLSSPLPLVCRVNSRRDFGSIGRVSMNHIFCSTAPFRSSRQVLKNRGCLLSVEHIIQI